MTLSTRAAIPNSWVIVSDVPMESNEANIVTFKTSDDLTSVPAYRDGSDIRVRLPELGPGNVHVLVDGSYVGELTVSS
jgi:hypothetical protein